MSFLQPILLAGLPLIGLPILIHLINRWRHKTLPWGAMMFLLAAKRMNRGMARLRFWLIMAMRMLAIAALLFAMARPLTSGWVGLAIGGQAETTLILLDRSASMEQQELATARSKRTAALTQVADVLRSAGRGSRIVLIESTAESIQEFDSPDALVNSLATTGTATSADLPGLMQRTLDYVVANATGRTDVWVCSDMRANDWKADDGRWTSVRDGFQTLDGVKFYLLTYADPARDNVAVTVENVRQRGVDSERELLFDIRLTREGEAGTLGPVPCELLINGTRSVVNIEMTGNETLLQGHQVALDDESAVGWGRVEIPADENPLDNVSYFVFADPPEHVTTIVYDDESVAAPFEFAATAPLDPAVTYTTEVLPATRADEVDFGRSSLIIWQAKIPDGLLAEQLIRFVESGRPVLFFPPASGGRQSSDASDASDTPSDGEYDIFGITWVDWQQARDEAFFRVASWRGDSDLWAHSASGEPLGIGELRTFAYRELRGAGGSPLARLDGGDPLLYRVTVDGGAAYFCATLPVQSYSSLAQDGLAFYALIQRALTKGAATQSNARNIVAGSRAAQQVADWQPSDAASRRQLLSSRWLNAGSYENGVERLALNRPPAEDMARVLDEEEADGLFDGLDAQHVRQSLATAGALTSEVWRAVLGLMALALIVEAFLCLPEPRTAIGSRGLDVRRNPETGSQKAAVGSPRSEVEGHKSETVASI